MNWGVFQIVQIDSIALYDKQQIEFRLLFTYKHQLCEFIVRNINKLCNLYALQSYLDKSILKMHKCKWSLKAVDLSWCVKSTYRAS